MSSSQVFLYFCLSFIGGVFINSFFNISFPIFLGLLVIGFLLILIFWRRKRMVMFGFCIFFVAIGVWRYQIAEFKIRNNEFTKYNVLDQKISLIGKVVKEPDVREKSIKLTIKPENIEGKVLVTTNRYPEYQYGDKLKITGKLLTPPTFEGFNYRDYLQKEGIYSVMYWPEIEVLAKNQGNQIYTNILFFKNKLRETIYQNLSPPQSSILGAMILGDKSRISQKWKEKLNYAGVRHLTAISGMHVAILTSLLMTLLIGLGFRRQPAFYFAIILIALFIIMTGLQPSAIRAGIMGGLFLLAQHLGRMGHSSRAIVTAATGMLTVNPLLLKMDIGFQLSFLAMIGIIYLGPIFQTWFKKIPEEKFLNLRSIIAITFSAQIVTLPVLIYNFGYISLVSPLTNVLIVPLLPLILALGFLFGLVGIFGSVLGWILSWPTWFLLTYLIKIVDFFSSLPFSSLTLEISWSWLLPAYLLLGVITWRLQEKQKLKILNY